MKIRRIEIALAVIALSCCAAMAYFLYPLEARAEAQTLNTLHLRQTATVGNIRIFKICDVSNGNLIYISMPISVDRIAQSVLVNGCQRDVR